MSKGDTKACSIFYNIPIYVISSSYNVIIVSVRGTWMPVYISTMTQ